MVNKKRQRAALCQAADDFRYAATPTPLGLQLPILCVHWLGAVALLVALPVPVAGLALLEFVVGSHSHVLPNNERKIFSK